VNYNGRRNWFLAKLDGRTASAGEKRKKKEYGKRPHHYIFRFRRLRPVASRK
jgi:hypothetical protein